MHASDRPAQERCGVTGAARSREVYTTGFLVMGCTGAMLVALPGLWLLAAHVRQAVK
jgi:hypothetical protein